MRHVGGAALEEQPDGYAEGGEAGEQRHRQNDPHPAFEMKLGQYRREKIEHPHERNLEYMRRGRSPNGRFHRSCIWISHCYFPRLGLRYSFSNLILHMYDRMVILETLTSAYKKAERHLSALPS